ncbi:MAG TPA: hypothetical protein VNO69_05530 [Methyloceanibacter sp.]|nr:hypothetical protein [Methyloceanibacter sp.]
MTATAIRRRDIGRFISFLLIALAITFALGALSLGALFVSGALYFPLLYYPGAIPNETAAWSLSAVYLLSLIAASTVLSAGKRLPVALAIFLGASLGASVCTHLIMAAFGFSLQAI